MTENRSTSKDMDAALLQERPSYDEMRALVSEPTLPAGQCAPLDREQTNAVANYEHARERVRLLHASHSAIRPGSDFPLDIDPIDLEPQG